MHDRRTWPQRDMLTAGVDEMQILLARCGERAVADDPVLEMENDLLVAKITIRAQVGVPARGPRNLRSSGRATALIDDPEPSRPRTRHRRPQPSLRSPQPQAPSHPTNGACTQHPAEHPGRCARSTLRHTNGSVTRQPGVIVPLLLARSCHWCSRSSASARTVG
jgi:hypothetical protein